MVSIYYPASRPTASRLTEDRHANRSLAVRYVCYFLLLLLISTLLP